MTVTERSYGQYCGVARALDLVGERWALLVVRELLLGPRRFTDLQQGLPGVSTNVLAARLRGLEGAGVVRRATLPPPAASAVYELTDYGRDLGPIVQALGRWGARTLGPREPARQALRSRWLALALRAFFHPESALGVSADYEVRLRDGAFRLAVRDGEVEVAEAPAPGAETVLEADDDTLVGLLAGELDPRSARESGVVVVAEGAGRDLERFVELFRFSAPRP
ncbi:MAG TPA: winged helix-turn-helix transcriptional regulator [Gaiellaceae bacterium]|nr:winged helix-turn-helix transcriptional regulator [Gaiellaceae bacterium]